MVQELSMIETESFTSNLVTWKHHSVSIDYVYSSIKHEIGLGEFLVMEKASFDYFSEVIDCLIKKHGFLLIISQIKL